MIWGVKVFLLIILFYILNELIDPIPSFSLRDTSPFSLLTFVSIKIATIFGLVLALLSRSMLVRWSVLTWSILTYGLQTAYLCANGSGFHAEEAYMLLSSSEAAPDCIRMYWKLALSSILALILILVLLTNILRRFVISFSPWWVLLSIAIMGLSLFITWSGKGFHTHRMNTPYRITSTLAYLKATRYLGNRQQPFIPFNNAGLKRFPHIVLIVDESVLGSELSINGYARPTAPFLQSHQSIYWNGGIASSGAITTSESHYIMLSGLRTHQLPDTEMLSQRNPSVFQYAVQAGYPSLCLSAQRMRSILTGGLPAYSPNLFSYSEKINLEHDFDLIKALQKHIMDNQESFTYIVKQGCHFPYALRYPKKRTIFLPTTPSAWSDDLGPNVNNYDNALLWNSDEFLSRMTVALGSTHKNILVLYTSDHGQVLQAQTETRIWSSHMPHGGSQLPPLVANVPLVVFGFGSKGSAFVHELKSNENLVNNCSHFQIFPTLLIAMGYPPEDVHRQYGDSLLDHFQPGRPRYFIAGRLNSPQSKIRLFPAEQNTIATILYAHAMK